MTGGVFCFGYFPLDKQRKVTRQPGETGEFSCFILLALVTNISGVSHHAPIPQLEELRDGCVYRILSRALLSSLKKNHTHWLLDPSPRV